jgi:hypothetical protein
LKLARGGDATVPSPSSNVSSRGIKCQHSLPLAACDVESTLSVPLEGESQPEP